MSPAAAFTAVDISASVIAAKLFIMLLAITNSDVSSDACSGSAPAATD